MSSFMCSPEHFGLLAAFAVNRPDPHTVVIPEWRKPARQDAAVHVAEQLARENARSLAARYGDDPAQYADTIAEAGVWAALYLTKGGAIAAAVPLPRILSYAKCYAYQACESPDWEDTLAFAQIDRIINACGPVVRAPDTWEWTDPSRAAQRAAG